MRFRNGKRKIGLIALLSCVLTATVAFAAYTGLNYINGQTEIMGNPFKMVFVDNYGKELVDPYELPSSDYASTEGNAELSGDITVSPDGSSINDFKVKLYKPEDSVTYTLKLKNTGGATAYLSGVDIAATTMPTDSAGSAVSGLDYSISLGNGTTITSTDGEVVSETPSLSVAPGATVDVTLTVKATKENLFSAWTVPEGGPVLDGSYGATFTLGQITITWSAVDPSTGS